MAVIKPKDVLLGAMIFLMSIVVLIGYGVVQNQKQEVMQTKQGFENLAEAPIVINSIKAEDAPMYNEATISYTNNTNKIIGQIEFDLLLFDKSGNPIVDTSSHSSNKHIINKNQLLPNASVSGKWYIQKGALIIKARLDKVVFIDGTTWNDPDMGKWIEREITKY